MSILDVLGIIVKPVTDYINNRQNNKAAEAKQKLELDAAVHERQVELIKQGLAADASWELTFAQQAASSWKDEYTLIVVSIPAIMAFIPRLSPYVEKGFLALDKTPLWYQLIFGSIFLATYGIRYWRRSQSDT